MIDVILILAILGVALEVMFAGIEHHSRAECIMGVMLLLALIVFVYVVYGN